MSTNNNEKGLRKHAAAGNISALQWTGISSPRNLTVFLLMALVLLSGMGVVYSTFKKRYALHELQQLRGQHNDLEVQWGQLLIEESTFGLEGRIESLAREELQMEVPDWSGVVMVKYE